MRLNASSFSNFLSPPSAFRAKPFWSLNGELEADELRRQLEVFRDMGFGGAFLHSRFGLRTPYLGDDWFQRIRDSVRACADLGLEAWLYDEDRWPSGFGGGFVTRTPAFRRRCLHAEFLPPGAPLPAGDWLTVFRLWTPDSAAGAEPILPDEAADRPRLAFRVRVEDPHPRYNGWTHADSLNPAATAEFLRLTHEAYAREVLPHAPPGAVPGLFTDEPSYGTLQREEGRWVRLPWTDRLPTEFAARFGYDPIPRLPHLVLSGDDVEGDEARRDYAACLAAMFEEAFFLPCADWCARRGLRFTGHLLGEESLYSQTASVGSAMRMQRHLHIPGVDVLTAEGTARPGARPPKTVSLKQCDSVRHQFGRADMLSELYGCTGWDTTLAEYRAMGDWQAVLGVTLRCPHLAHYSLEGERKRDFPASISFQSAWWRAYRPLEDRFARIAAAQHGGRPLRELAVLHPLETAWALGAAAQPERIHELDRDLERLSTGLLGQHVDFDFLDEELLARHGAVRDGRLHLEQAGYRAVLVPGVRRLRASTRTRLASFQAAGGLLLIQGDGHGLVGRPVSGDPAELRRILAETSGVQLPSIRAGAVEAESVWMRLLTHHDGSVTLLMVNRDGGAATGELEVELPVRGTPQIWDPDSGTRWGLPFRTTETGIRFHARIPPHEAALFRVLTGPTEEPPTRPEWSPAQSIPLRDAPIPISLSAPNALPLDRAVCHIDGDPGPMPMEDVLLLDRRLRRRLDLPERTILATQPWVRGDTRPDRALSIRLRFTFQVETLPNSGCALVMEHPERFDPHLNGVPLRGEDGWWIDPSFRRLPFPAGRLQAGENVVELTHRFDGETGLEAMYLLGEFGVRTRGLEGILTARPEALSVGDWTAQGLPFHTEGVVYHLDVHIPTEGEWGLQLPRWRGAVCRVRIDGAATANVFDSPGEVHLSTLSPGRHRIDVEVVPTRRNLLGPLHLAGDDPNWCGPECWIPVGDARSDAWRPRPAGLLTPPILHRRHAWAASPGTVAGVIPVP